MKNSARSQKQERQQALVDRKATELPTNAHVAIIDIDDPLGSNDRTEVVVSLRD
jgi:hypothetical protein